MIDSYPFNRRWQMAAMLMVAMTIVVLFGVRWVRPTPVRNVSPASARTKALMQGYELSSPLLMKADIARRAGDLDKAASLYRSAMAVAPVRYPTADIALGDVLAQKGQLSAAADAYIGGYILQMSDTWVCAAKTAIQFADQKKFDQAVAWYNIAVGYLVHEQTGSYLPYPDLSPTKRDMPRLVGILEGEVGRYDRHRANDAFENGLACKELERSVRELPEDRRQISVWREIGDNYEWIGQYQKSLEAYRSGYPLAKKYGEQDQVESFQYSIYEAEKQVRATR